jgi:voltage-gated potassium channel Kch
MASKVVIFCAGGRVGSAVASALLGRGVHAVLVDLLPQLALEQRAARLLIDRRLAGGPDPGRATVYGGVDIADGPALQAILAGESPDLVVNYAIPITWDATRQLSNYDRVSAAGLGAFAPIQLLAPLAVARAMAAAGCDVPLLVGNLPDITAPVLVGMATREALPRPSCGAGNVGLIEAGLQALIAREWPLLPASPRVSLVAHHVHWVAPREPGYSNDAPFLLHVESDGREITDTLGDARSLLNRAITTNYEPGAGFSTTTGLLAARAIEALLDQSDARHRLHLPAPGGLPGGYPVTVCKGRIALALPGDWSAADAESAMRGAQQRDGVAAIDADGTVHFSDVARDILRSELAIALPAIMAPGDIEMVAASQIDRLRSLLN